MLWTAITGRRATKLSRAVSDPTAELKSRCGLGGPGPIRKLRGPEDSRGALAHNCLRFPLECPKLSTPADRCPPRLYIPRVAFHECLTTCAMHLQIANPQQREWVANVVRSQAPILKSLTFGKHILDKIGTKGVPAIPRCSSLILTGCIYFSRLIREPWGFRMRHKMEGVNMFFKYFAKQEVF